MSYCVIYRATCTVGLEKSATVPNTCNLLYSPPVSRRAIQTRKIELESRLTTSAIEPISVTIAYTLLHDPANVGKSIATALFNIAPFTPTAVYSKGERRRSRCRA